MSFRSLYLSRILACVPLVLALVVGSVSAQPGNVIPQKSEPQKGWEKLSIEKLPGPNISSLPKTQTPEMAAKAKAAADAAAAARAARAIEMAETVEQAKKRIQAIPVEKINSMEISRPHAENVFRGLPPSFFCTLSKNERQAFSDNQINGLRAQAALNFLWCLEMENNESVPGVLRRRVLKECPKHHLGYCDGSCPPGNETAAHRHAVKCIAVGSRMINDLFLEQVRV
jgi:hypothetical protein